MKKQFDFPAVRHIDPESPDVGWHLAVPSIKSGDTVETGQIQFSIAPKRKGTRLMQVDGLRGVWAPGVFPTCEADEEKTRLVLMRVQFITLLKFRDDIPPIPNQGPIGDDDEPISTAPPRLRRASHKTRATSRQ